MKKIVFLTCFLMLLRPVFPVLQYVLDYDYISKVLCVNKEKPQLHCNGKCHLMKELAKASENQAPASPDKKNVHQETETLFFSTLPQFIFGAFADGSPWEINSRYSDLYEYAAAETSFRPPAFLS